MANYPRTRRFRWLPLLALVCCQASCNEHERVSAEVSEETREAWVYPLREAMLASSAGGNAAAEVLEPTGWATITGKFVYGGGSAPVGSPVAITADATTCGAFNLRDESLVVNPANMGLANVFVYLRTKGFGDPHPSYTPGEEVILANKGCRFEPHAMGIWMQNTLVVTNEDPVAHNTDCSAAGDPSGSFNQVIAALGNISNINFTRSQARPANVKCSIHPWMAAKVLPRENPYFATTDVDGNFRIENVPAGIELDFQVYHEVAGNLNADSSWTNGRFKVTLENDQTLDMGTITVSPAMVGR